MKCESMTILMAEDDEGHACLVKRNLERAGIANQVVHVTDGQQALDYLYCQGTYASRPSAGTLLLLLDINMPRIDGTEVLRRVKANSATARLPVIMLTTTDDPRDVRRCYEAGCNVYIAKPLEYEAFAEAVKRLGLFLQVVMVPDELTAPGGNKLASIRQKEIDLTDFVTPCPNGSGD